MKKIFFSLALLAVSITVFAQRAADYFPIDNTKISYFRCIDKNLDLNYTWTITQIDNCSGLTCVFFELKQQPGFVISAQGNKPIKGGNKTVRYFSFSDKEVILKNIAETSSLTGKTFTTYPNQTYLRIPKNPEKPYQEDKYIGEEVLSITIEYKPSITTFYKTYNDVMKMTASLESQRGVVSKEECYFAKNIGLVSRKVYKSNGSLDPYQTFELEKTENK